MLELYQKRTIHLSPKGGQPSGETSVAKALGWHLKPEKNGFELYDQYGHNKGWWRKDQDIWEHEVIPDYPCKSKMPIVFW